jgi:serine/threonine protein kinase/Tol biopolymer transport system component
MIWSRSLDPERWRRLEALLDHALDLSGSERDAFLDRECRDDPRLADEVRAILVAGEQSDPFLDTAAPRLGAALLGEERVSGPVPERVGPYQIERLIGEGGMGSVYLAHRVDGEFDQRVALKLVRHGLHLDARIVRRFREERQILAALNHPGIARLFDGGITGDNLPYFAMEYVEGLPITRYCEARGLSLEERLGLFVRVCDAVAHAHAKKIVHRDIKPSNILVTDSGEPRLLDFGIAKLLDADPGSTELTRRSERLLTPEYASPEQIRGEPVVMASDVYALGVLLYELVTGRRPFTRVGRTAHELERAVLEEEPTRPSEAAPHETLRRRLRGDLDAIILSAMSKHPSRRYPSAAEVGADVARHLRGEAITAPSGGRAGRVRHWSRTHRIPLTAATLAVLAAAGVIGAVVNREEEQAGDPVLRTLRLSSPQRVTSEEGLELDPAISPDGNHVAYAAGVEGAMRIFVRQREGSRAVAISGSLGGNHRRPRWSPDGTRILFQAERGLWLAPALGGSPQLVVAPPADTVTAHSAAWAPDGTQLAWVTHDTIYVRELTAERPRVLATATVPHSLDWSPDGRWIAMASGNAEFVYHRIGNLGPSALYLLPARCDAGVSCDAVLLAPPTSLNTSPAWLDASRLVFVSSRNGPRDLFAVSIGRYGEVMQEPVPLSAGQDMHTVSAAADGRTLAYSLFRQNSNIWALDISTGTPRRLSDATRITSGQQTVEGVALSPDGKWLAFDANRTGYQDIYVVSAEGGEAERVVFTRQDKFHPSWSPDGQTLAFYTFEDGVRRAVTAPARGGPVRLIHPDGPVQEEHTPVWTRDGLGLIYFRIFVDRSELYAVRRVSDSTWSEERQLTRQGGMWPTFSADGSRMAYVATPGLVRVMGPDFDESTSSVALDASAPASNGVIAISAAITPDGGTILVKGEDANGSGFWSIPASGGAPRLLARLDDGRRTSPRPEFTSDGRRIFFTLTEREADVWAARLEDR